KVPLAVLYVDHNMLQIDYRNAEDHLFLQTFAARYGIHYSRPGNGICHQIHTERYARPGAFMIGSDSHTPTSGAVGCLAIGSGGIDIATALAGYAFDLRFPIICGVRLEGELSPWVQSKDVILEMLRRLTVKGGVDRIYEFHGPGVKTLSVMERAPICNMITELGATSAIFPSDERTRDWLCWQKREHDWIPLAADPSAQYDEQLTINLSELEPLIACPHSPDNVVPVWQVAGREVAQVCFGSSVNSWYPDLALPAAVLRGNKIPTTIQSVTVNPGSRQILDTIDRAGILADLIEAGTRILEPSCGPCVGMGYAPPEGLASVRTFNRNFKGRSGTWNDAVYLCSPATAAATALTGVITDPRTLGQLPTITLPEEPAIDDRFVIVPPLEEAESIRVFHGRNIVPPPPQSPLSDSLMGSVLIVLGDNVSTGSMSPDGAQVMADRSNLEAISKYCFIKEDRDFVRRARDARTGFIVAGENYGQGSSREHAALAPKYLGVAAVFAKSFARIHRRNLIYQGMLPLLIKDDFLKIAAVGARWLLPTVRFELEAGRKTVTVQTEQGRQNIRHDLSPREIAIVLSGGILSYLSRSGMMHGAA
ncbi:MAG: aconitate hydratase, partial [Deltaproteobacteria bacterium]|nr:aconitate hydratase [Deltaproteobacteria bacterium]